MKASVNPKHQEAMATIEAKANQATEKMIEKEPEMKRDAPDLHEKGGELDISIWNEPGSKLVLEPDEGALTQSNPASKEVSEDARELAEELGIEIVSDDKVESDPLPSREEEQGVERDKGMIHEDARDEMGISNVQGSSSFIKASGNSEGSDSNLEIMCMIAQMARD